MVKKLCRLCFKHSTKPIGIFSSKGIELNIAEIIRGHFPDELNETDNLPKWICLDCWIKSKYFHEFYNAVATAKNIYLTNLVKAQVPTFFEIDCNPFAREYDIPSVEDEAIIGEDANSKESPTDNAFETESSTQENNDIDVKCIEHSTVDGLKTEYEKQRNNDLAEYGSEDDVIAHDKTFGEVKCKENVCEEYGTFTGGILSAKEAADLATKVHEKTSKSAGREFTKLIPYFFDMVCELCKYEFKSLNDVFRHYRYQHDNAKVNVKCCPQPINSADLREHILYHLNPELYKCPECGKKFALGRQYRLHAQTHQLQLMNCDICGKKFSCKRGIIKHMNTVHGRNKGRFECDICNKRFNAKLTMQEHVKIEHQHLRHVCHVCAKEYRTWPGLQSHLRSHSDKGPRIKCKMCGNLFINMYRLRLHKAKDHENATLLQCPHCPKMKTNLFQLKKHIAHSHNYKVHKCELCEREFRSPVEVSRHMKIHIRGELFKCDYCPKQYTQQRDTTKHMKTVHPIEWGTDPIKLATGN